MFERKSFENKWEGKMEPFRIVGNVYFVGCFPASTHIIDTGEGLILIDPGYMSTFHLVIDSIYRLGFSPYEIRYIVNTHWHGDHTEATAALAHMTGARTLIGRRDFEKAKPHFTADIQIQDGDILTLGSTTLSFMETPGHTEGTVSFFFDTCENGITYRVGSFGGAGANTMVPARFDFPGCREAYIASIKRLKKEKVDVFIGNHVWNNNTEVFGELLRTTGENRFLDSSLWGRFLDFCLDRVNAIIEKETPIEIRPYEAADFDRLCQIHDPARKKELELAELSEAFLPLTIAAHREGLFDYQLYVADYEGVPAGFVAFTEDELAWLYVDPALTRRRIGSRLIAWALSKMEEDVSIEVLAGNSPAMAAYAAFGFEVAETVHGVMPGNETFPVTVHVMKR